MHIVYVIRSKTKKFTYVGFTNNLSRRMTEHNSGFNKSTKSYKPFELIYTEEVSTRIEARSREKFLKSGKGREYIKEIIRSNLDAGSP